jgi:hypothetical protein
MHRNTIRNIARRARIITNAQKISFGYPNENGEITRRVGYVFNLNENIAGIPYARLVIQGKGFRSYHLDKMVNIRKLT